MESAHARVARASSNEPSEIVPPTLVEGTITVPWIETTEAAVRPVVFRNVSAPE